MASHTNPYAVAFDGRYDLDEYSVGRQKITKTKRGEKQQRDSKRTAEAKRETRLRKDRRQARNETIF